ncbi:MAG TPA: hypothetical protein VIJ14_10475 [Rhabdochlamydiaceae bacterium]
MKNNLKLALPIALLTTSLAFGDDLTEQQTVIVEQKEENNYARASLDYDIFWAPASLDNYYPAYNESGKQIGRYRVQEKQNSQYQGVRFTWEWLEPNFLYAGLNLQFAGGNIHNKAYVNDVKVDDRHTSSNLWINKDFGLGYNYQPFPNSGFLLSVFAGHGSHYERKYQKKAHWHYGLAGFKIAQDLTKSLTMGVDFKTMYTYHVWDPYNVTSFERKGDRRFWGIELGTPVTWHFGEKRRFDLKIKPYILKLNVNSNSTILGTTIGIGYTY